MFGAVLNRLATSVRRALSDYSVGNQEPNLALDFVNNKYITNSSSKNFSNAITHSRSGNAVMTDGYGPELVVNGGFDSGTDGWSVAGTSCTLSYDNGKAQTVCTGTDGNSRIGRSVGTLTAGTAYIFTLQYYEASSYGFIRVTSGSITGSSIQQEVNTINNGNRRVTMVFVPSTTQEYFVIAGGNFTAGSVSTFDNVSVREMPVLKWAPHNLIVDSDDLTGLGSTAGVTRTETTLTETTGTGSHTINMGYIPVVGEKYTIACEVKLESGTRFVSFRGFGEGGAGEYPIFNLVNGTIAVSGSKFTDLSITAVGDGYYLLKASIVCIASFSWAIHMQDTATSGSGGYSYTGDGTSAIAIRKIRQYRSELGGMVDNPDKSGLDADFVPTTGTIAYLPRVGHHVYNGSAWVNEGLLAESEARTNLIDPSDFNTSWTTTNATKTDNAAVGPDGLSSAIKLEGNATIAAHNIKRGAVSVSATTTHTFSVFAKAGTHDIIGLRMDGNSSGGKWATFDLTNGLARTGGVGVASDSVTIQDIGNGWFRCSSTATTDASDTTFNPHIHLLNQYTSPTTSYDATGEYVYLYGAQLEEGYTPSSYIPTDSATVTRAAETFTISSANLPWPSPNYIGSELVTNGTFDTDTTGWTVSGNATLSSVSGELEVDGDANTFAVQSISVTAGKVYRLTGTARLGTHDGSARVYIGTSLVAVTSTENTDVEIIYVAVSSSTNINLRLHDGVTGGTAYFDNISVREINPLSVSIATEGRVTYADDGANLQAAMISWGGATGYIRHQLRTEGANTGTIRVWQNDSAGTSDTAESDGDAYEEGILRSFNMAGRHGSTFINGALNGVAFTENTTPTELYDLSATDLDLAYDYMGTIGTFRVWDKDLGDTGIVEATNPSLEPSLSLTFEGTGTNSFVVNDWSE